MTKREQNKSFFLSPSVVALTESFIFRHKGSFPYLSVEGEGAGLALGADPLGPGGVALTARLDLTAEVLQSCKLPSGRNEKKVSKMNNK